MGLNITRELLGPIHSYFLYCSECSAAHLIRISACPGRTPRLQLRQRQTRFCRFGSCPGARLGNAALCFAPAPASAAPLTWPRLPRSSLCPQGSGSVPGTAGQGNAAKRRLYFLPLQSLTGTAPRLLGGSAGGPASPTWALGGRGASLTTRPGSTSFPARVSSLGGPLWQRLGAGRCAGRQKRKNNGRAGSERGRASGRSRNPEVSA